MGLYEPPRGELEAVALEFQLHELAVENAVKAHQRPKLERSARTARDESSPAPMLTACVRFYGLMNPIRSYILSSTAADSAVAFAAPTASRRCSSASSARSSS